MIDYAVTLMGNPLHENDPKKAYAFLQSRGTFNIDEVADHMVAHGRLDARSGRQGFLFAKCNQMATLDDINQVFRHSC